MPKVNQVFNEKIKCAILEALMKEQLSFSEIMLKAKIRDSGRINYHLRRLLFEKIIQKQGNKYSATPLGERTGVYINQLQSKETYPIPVVCVILENMKKEILLIKRAKNPQKGRWSFPGGKARIGETLEETAKRELYEETNLSAKFEKVVGFFPSIFYKDGELSFHANIMPIKMTLSENKESVLLNREEHSDYLFTTLEKAKKMDLVPNNLRIISKLSSEKFVFEEIVYKE